MARIHRFFTAALAAASCWTLHVSAADACSCSGGPDMRPRQQDEMVPTNTKVWVWLGGQADDSCPNPTIRHSDGTIIPSSATILEPDMKVVTPAELLEVGVTYSVACDDDLMLNEFTVSAEEDLVAPAAPSFEVDAYSVSDDGPAAMCGPHEWVSLSVAGEGDFTVLDIAGRANLEPSMPEGSVVDFQLHVTDSVRIGQRPCSGTNWSFEEDGTPTDVRLGRFDLAGNFSGWSTTQNVDLEELQDEFDAENGGGCACSTTPSGSGSGAWALALLGLGALIRRRRA